MRVLMLVWTGVATDTRVLREAGALVEAGHDVHIIGRAVPTDFAPPPGITVVSAGVPPRAQGRARPMRWPERAVRWALLPVHIDRRLRAWTSQARDLALDWAGRCGPPDVVHAHDFTTLELAADLADRWGVPFVYDTHEYWRGRPVEGRPAPLRARRERRVEDEVAARAAGVITVGDGIADALRADHPQWPTISVVRNTFPLVPQEEATEAPLSAPQGAVYAGRLARDRELETIAVASHRTEVPITLLGPADEAWLSEFDPGRCTVRPALPIAEVDAVLRRNGLALITHSDAWTNHRLALPNKLFHALSLGIPVVATDVGELGATVRHLGCGVLYPPGDAVALADAIDAVCEDYPSYLARAQQARSEADWTRDKEVLLDVYAGVLHEQQRHPQQVSHPESDEA